MGEQWLKKVRELLEAAGIPCYEEYPPEPMHLLREPVAVAGIHAFDWEKGTGTILVRILSPRKEGGWTAQNAAIRAMLALEKGQIYARTEEMEYRGGSDCFEVPVRCAIRLRPDPAMPPRPWSVTINGRTVHDLEEFSAVREGDRRMVGTLGSSKPHTVSPGLDGWQIRMVRRLPANAMDQRFESEPMEICVTRGTTRAIYTDACWDRVERSCCGRELTVEYRGFALGRREEDDSGNL